MLRGIQLYPDIMEFLFMFADDTALLADTSVGFLRQQGILSNFCVTYNQ